MFQHRMTLRSPTLSSEGEGVRTVALASRAVVEFRHCSELRCDGSSSSLRKATVTDTRRMGASTKTVATEGQATLFDAPQ